MSTKFYTLFCIFLLLFSVSHSETVKDLSVEITATVSNSPPKITLNWIANTGTYSYKIYKKGKDESDWGSEIATLPGSSNQFIDYSVVKQVAYEYKIVRIRNSGSIGYGYILSGVDIPTNDQNGKLILLIDNSFTSALVNEISQLIKDLEGDGWEVLRHDVSRNATVTSIKNIIVNDYLSHEHVKALYLLGHIPVPYSGNIYPDGHTNHEGAWPADVYYADIDGIWTDQYISNNNAQLPSNRNIPGDGKFDQSNIPSDLELQIGRVDLSGMTSFSFSEQDLLKNYLDKAHQYKLKQLTTLNQAIIDDNFGYFNGEAFSSCAYRNLSALCGPASVTTGDYFPSMTTSSYRWSFGCGGGTNSSVSGIGTTSNFASSYLDGTFTLLYGSYFGDWNNNNNFLRAPLCQGKMLASVWCGRPMWQFHHMALGESIGYSVLKNQNSDSLYYMNYGGRFVHYALMGDPSLRSEYIAPVPGVIATLTGGICHINWAESNDNVIGYNLYSKNAGSNTFRKLNSTPIIGTNYVDSCAVYPGIYTYMVRAIAVQQTPSGTYYSMSLGTQDTALSSTDLTFNSTVNFTINGNNVSFNAFTNGVSDYTWDFGDGGFSVLYNPTHQFNDGNHYVQLTLGNSCFSENKEIAISIGSNNVPLKPTNFTLSSTQVCQGSTINAHVDEVPGVTYQWNYSGTGIVFSDSSAHPIISIGSNATSGIISVTPINSVGSGLSQSKSLMILQKPVVTVTGATSVCAGTSTLLIAEGAEQYTWQAGNTTPSYSFAPTYDTTIYVIGKTLLGCSDTVYYSLLVHPLPTVNLISSVPSNTFCFGTHVTFNATPGYANYVFKNGNSVQKNSSDAFYSSNQLTNGSQIKVVVTDTLGCSNTSATITNLVSNTISAPSISLVSGTNPFCYGSTITLQSSYSSGNNWSNGSTSQTITVDSSTTVSLFFSSNGCSSNSVSFNAVEKQKVESHISGNFTTCANSTLLNANTYTNYGSALTYQWKNPDNSISNSISKTATQNGWYKLHIIPADACNSTIDSAYITLGNLTKPTLSLTDSISFCEGDSAIVNSSASNNIYWSNGFTNPSIVIKSNGNYFVTVTNGSCSLTSDTLRVRVIPHLLPPYISASGPTTFCEGYSVTLNGNLNGKWSDDNTTSLSKEIFTSGTYQVYVTNACGTTYSNSINIHVLPQPVAPFIYPNGNTKLCVNQSVQLAGNNNGGVWNNGSQSTSNNIVVSNSGVYFVTTTNSCGISFSNSIQVTSISSNNIQLFTIGNQNLCNNTGKVFISGNNGGTWNVGGTTNVLAVTDTGSYFVTQLNSCGTQFSNIIHIGNDSYPIQSIIFTFDSTAFCSGDSALIEGNSEGVWNIQNSSLPSIYAKTPGLYYVKNTNACGTAYSDTITITNLAQPNNPANTSGYKMCQGYQLQDGEGLRAKLDTSKARFKKIFSIPIDLPTSDVGSIAPGVQIASYFLPENLGLLPKEKFTNAYLFFENVQMNLPNQYNDLYIASTGSLVTNPPQNVTITPLDTHSFSLKIPIENAFIDLQGGIFKLFYAERSNEDINGPDCTLPTQVKLIINYEVNSEFSWYATPSPIDSISSDTIFNPFPGTTTYTSQYFYAANKLGECYSEFVPVLLDVQTPLISPTLTAIGGTTLCNGDSTLIIGNNNFLWNTDQTSKDSLWVHSNGTYFVSDSNACGTFTSNQILITTSSGVAPSIQISLNNTGTIACAGDLLQLDANTTNEGSNPTYKWYRNGFQFAQNSSTVLSPSLQNNDNIFCQLISSSDCVTNPIVNSDTIQLLLHPKGTWKASNNDNWNLSSNWCGGIPDTTTDVRIGLGSNFIPMLNGESFCKDLLISSTSKLILNNNTLRIYGKLTSTGKIQGSENSTLAFYGNENTGDLFMDNTNQTTKSLSKLILSKTAGSLSIGDTLRLVNELQLNDGNLQTNNKLQFVSNANSNARIAPVLGDANIIGKVISQRFIPQGLTGWVMLSNPVQQDSILDWMDDFATAGFTGATGSVGNFTSIYSYNENFSGTADIGFMAPTDSSDIIQLGKGYYAYVGTSSVNSADITVDACGEAYVGDFNFPLTYTPSIPAELPYEDGWNLLANPYCSAIDWDDTHWTKSNIGDAIYSYNTDAQQYSSYANGIGINGGTHVIEASQGFWVKANSPSPTLVSSELVKTNSNNFFFKNNTNTNLPANAFKIKLETPEGKDETVIRFLPGTTEQFDALVDAIKKISSNPKAPTLASNSANELYAINNLSQPTNDEIPLYTRVFKPGMLKFSFYGISALNQDFSLRDNQTGLETWIQNDTSIVIILIDTTNIKNRYSLVWEQNAITTSVQKETKSNPIRVFPNPAHGEDLFIQHLPSNSLIQLFNTWGDLVLTYKADSDVQKFNTNALPCGSYQIRITSKEHVITNLHWIKY